MAKEWLRFSEKENKNVHIVSIDCTATESQEICAQFEI
jgi:hypothetical protein